MDTDRVDETNGKICQSKPTRRSTSGSASMRYLFGRRKNLVLGLFAKCGVYPQQQDLDEFLVSNDLLCSFKMKILQFPLPFQTKHSDLFPDRNYLSLKIREYRQKHMNKSPPKSAELIDELRRQHI